LNLTIDVLELSKSLIDRGIELHGVLGCVLQCLLKVRNLTRELALRRLVLGILLLDLWQVFQLNCFSLEHRSLHILDHLLLLLSKLLISQLHSMDLFSHGYYLSLTNSWIQVVLHFLLELYFSLPKKNLSLSLNDFSKDVSLLLLEVGDLVFQTDRLILKFLQLLFEFVFNIEVVILELGLEISILVKQVIKLVHLEVKVLLGNFKLSDLFLV